MYTQKLELNKMGLAPMQTCELQEMNGGFFGPIILTNLMASVASAVGSIIDAAKAGFNDAVKNS